MINLKKRVLSAGDRKHMPKSSFAVPGKKAYPINDANHARNALARVSQFGSPAEKEQVRAKVHSKFPNIGKRKAKRGPIGTMQSDYQRKPKAKRSSSKKRSSLGQIGTKLGTAMASGKTNFENNPEGGEFIYNPRAAGLAGAALPKQNLNTSVSTPMKSRMPQRRTNKSMSGMQLLGKAMRSKGK